MPSQQDKAERFAARHRGSEPLVLPNPWDAGTARLLERMGFEALATTGGGFAFASGQPDGTTTRDAMLSYVSTIATSTDLPVTADLEDGFGDDPVAVHDTVLAAARCGAVGASVEDRSYGDGSRNAGTVPFDLGLAAARVRAAVEAARSLPYPFVVTARCENLLIGRADLADTIGRLHAFQEVGADCLYAPGLATLAQVRDVVVSVDRPVNVLIGRSDEPMSVHDLGALGVRRISVGSGLARAALAAVVSAATELLEHGTCNFADTAIPHQDTNDLFGTAGLGAGGGATPVS